jgi:DNA-binding protein HU-beta
MNKSQVVQKIAEKTELPKKEVAQAVDTFIDVVVGALKENEKVTLLGFGTFSAATKAARTARNPKSREEIQVPAKTVAKFKPGKELQDALND